MVSPLTWAVLPTLFDSTAFIADPANHIVHVDRLTNRGVTFTASRLHGDKEFLASTDAWFTPVNHYIGPDGSLYIVDMYRRIIEHPEWLGEELVKSGQLYNGSDRGRIYRVTASGGKSAEWTKGLKLGDATALQLVEKLAEPNIWWRMNAQRMLVDRSDKQAIPALEQMAVNKNSAMGRLHALWTLEGMEALRPQVIQVALKDTDKGIRENAIKLAELHLRSSPALGDALLTLADDTNPKVRYQLLCTLGSLNTESAVTTRNKILFSEINDKWFQVAALSAPYAQTGPLLKVTLDNFKEGVPAYVSLVQRLTNIIGSGGDDAQASGLINLVTKQIRKRKLGGR